MKKIFVLALGLLVVPQLVSAQLEVGLDGGFTYSKIDDIDDSFTEFSAPTSYLRLGFMGGESLIIETALGLDWASFGDFSSTSVAIVPGVNFMVTPQVYVRGEAGLLYEKEDNGITDSSSTQYLFGGGVGMRRALGEGALLRLEAGVDRLLENTDEGIPASWDIRALVGISAVIGG
jgi:hypothetical protein